MKSTPTWFRAIVMLALASLAVGCASSSGSPTYPDAGSDSKGTGGAGGGAGGASPDASSDTHPDAGDAPSDGGGLVDGHADAGDTSLPPAPVLVVKQGNVPVTAGSTVTVGGAVVGASTSTVFTISDTGNAALTVSGVTVAPAGVLSLTAQPDASVAAGGSTMFTIGFSPSAVGTSTATVTIANSASAGFSFTISATATAAPQPAIAVSSSAGDIANGATLAYGSVAAGTPTDQTITIRNPGTAALVLSSNPAVSAGAGFTLKTPPASLSIAAGSMTTFVVTFTPTGGDATGTITIANNTTDNATFTINLTGTGTITATGFNVTGANGATSIGTVGGTLQLTATVVPDGATNPGVTWSSGTPGVATVDANGLVTAIASGQTTITATAADSSGITGTLTITVAIPFVYFVTQTPTTGTATTTATLASGAFSVSSTYGTSGNAFKFVSPNFYGTSSNGFIAFPTPMTGDFTISATVSVTSQIKANTACGLGVGMTTGFLGTDSYAYALMRNSSPASVMGVINEAYVSSASAVSIPTAFGPSFTNNTPTQITFSRIGTNVTVSVTPMGGTTTAATPVATTTLTNGTTNYGAGAVYPAITFNNIAATITNLTVTDGTGATVFDSATGILVKYVPASLTLSSSAVAVTKNGSAPVTATALAVGGTVSSVSAVAADPTIVTVSVANGATNSTITLTGLQSGTTNVTVTNLGDTNSATNTKVLQVTVNDFPTTDGYGPLTTAYPAPGAINAYTDGELALTFDAAPTLNTGGSIKIYRTSDGTQVDSINFAGETQTFGTTVINVGSQLARVSGNTVFFAPHLGKLAYGTSYYVVIPTPAISGTLNTVAFTGLSNLNTVATWNFTTRAAPALDTTNITVDGAQASVANFRTVQGALGAVAGVSPAPTSATINVAAGTYNELVHYTGPGGTPLTQTINIIGPTSNNALGANCVVQYVNGNTPNPSTQGRASAYFAGTNLVLQNITFRNNAPRATYAQAEALYFASGTGGTLAANNSSFFSNQDTIQTSGRSWFYNCHVEGNVDFIWGTGDAALFENCSLRFVNDIAGGGAASYSLFVARTGTTIAAGGSGTVGKGYVLLNSTVSVDPNVTAFFGRDAGTGAFYDQVALIGVTFSTTGNGVLGTGLWNITTPPLSLVDPSFIGWKAAGCMGLMADTIPPATGTSGTINSQATEYDTRDHILNRVVTVTTGAPSGFQAAATTWDVSGLATAFGAPAQP